MWGGGGAANDFISEKNICLADLQVEFTFKSIFKTKTFLGLHMEFGLKL